jgi:hypothetical protein
MGVLLLSAILLLFVRPALVDIEFLYQTANVAAAGYLFLYFIPALVFVLAFVLLRKVAAQDTSDDRSRPVFVIALVCGLVAVLIHNLIDFAIFEPANWSVFWLLAAILIAHVHNTKSDPAKTNPLTGPKRLGLFAGLFIGGIVTLSVVLIPPLRAEALLRRAMTGSAAGFSLMDEAVAADTLSAGTPYRAAALLTQVYPSQNVDNPGFLDRAAGYANIAIRRSPADFKAWRLRGQINVIGAEQTEGPAKQAALEKALDDFQHAVARYPGSGKLHYRLAAVAEQLGRDAVARCHYRTAVDIEDAYRAQFRVMYPGRDIISRLGDDAYQEAKAKIEALQQNTL